MERSESKEKSESKTAAANKLLKDNGTTSKVGGEALVAVQSAKGYVHVSLTPKVVEGGKGGVGRSKEQCVRVHMFVTENLKVGSLIT
jgi:hypothetical protein